MTPLQFLREYERVSAAHDLAETMNMIDEDAIYFFSNESAHVGKPAVHKAIAANFDAIDMESFELKNAQCVIETAKAAVCVFEFHWSGDIQGTACSGFGRGTSVLRREGNSWQVIHEHLSKGSFAGPN